MEALGRVTQKLNENNVRVEILRSSACGGKCGECGNSCGSKSYIIAKNFDGAEKDDVVKIESSDKRVLALSFMVYIVPLLVIVLLYNFGGAVIKNETARAAAAFFGGIIAFVITVIFFRRLKKPVSRVYYKSETKEYKN